MPRPQLTLRALLLAMLIVAIVAVDSRLLPVTFQSVDGSRPAGGTPSMAANVAAVGATSAGVVFLLAGAALVIRRLR